MDIAVCTINFEHKTLQYAAAYRPLLMNRNGELTEIKGNKNPIGGTYPYKNKQFDNHTINFETGDSFYIFTDGYVDQMNTENRKYTTKRLRDALTEIWNKNMDEQHIIVEQNIRQWQATSEQLDDILFIGFRL